VAAGAGPVDQATRLEVRPQTRRELRREADLHRAAIGCFVGQRGDDAIAVAHRRRP